jgi:hypothetical protein
MPLTAGPLGALIGPEVAPLLCHLKIKSFFTFPFKIFSFPKNSI